MIGSQQLNDKKNIFVTNISAKVVLTEKCSVPAEKVSLRLTLRRYLEQISPNNFVVASSFSCRLLCVTRTSIFPFFAVGCGAACVDLEYFRLSPATKSILAYLLDDKAPRIFLRSKILMCFYAFYVTT